MGRKAILLTEFEFYNRDKKIISKKKINEIRKELESGNKEEIYWSNKYFCDNKIGFKFYRAGKYINNKSKNEYKIYATILKFKEPIKVSDIEKCRHFYKDKHIFHFDFTEGLQRVLEKINNCRSYYDDKTILKKCVYNSWDEIVEECILENHFQRYESKKYVKTSKDFFNDVKLLFGDEYVPKEEVKGELLPRRYNFYLPGRGYGHENLYYIMNVIEKRINGKNYRIALVVVPDSDNELCHHIKLFTEDDQCYTSIDKDRIYFNGSNNKKYFLDLSIREIYNNSIVLNTKVTRLLRQNISQLLADNEYVIPPSIYNFYSQRVGMFDRDSSLNYLSQRELQVLSQYVKIINSGKKVKIGDIEISKNNISLTNDNFNISWDYDFIDVADKFNNIRELMMSDVKYNFNLLYERILKLSSIGIINPDWTREREYKQFTKTSFTINNMKIDVIKGDNNRIKINDIFCRVSDVFYILSKAICFRSIEEYNKYIKDVSYIGIDWKLMISNGIVIELDNPFYDIYKNTGDSEFRSSSLRFSLSRDIDKRQQIYLMLNNKKYPIKYKGKFKNFFNSPRLHLTLEKLYSKLDECIEGLDDKLIIDIVSNAVEEAKIVKERGQALVIDTIKMIKANEDTIKVGDSNFKGYTFIGRNSGNLYFVNKINLDVYRKDNDGRWNRRCIVDDVRKQRIFEDKLANRLINIYNEPSRLKGYL